MLWRAPSHHRIFSKTKEKTKWKIIYFLTNVSVVCTTEFTSKCISFYQIADVCTWWIVQFIWLQLITLVSVALCLCVCMCRIGFHFHRFDSGQPLNGLESKLLQSTLKANPKIIRNSAVKFCYASAGIRSTAMSIQWTAPNSFCSNLMIQNRCDDREFQQWNIFGK